MNMPEFTVILVRMQ